MFTACTLVQQQYSPTSCFLRAYLAVYNYELLILMAAFCTCLSNWLDCSKQVLSEACKIIKAQHCLALDCQSYLPRRVEPFHLQAMQVEIKLHLVCEELLVDLPVINLFLYGATSNEPIDYDLFLLPNSPGPFASLHIS